MSAKGKTTTATVITIPTQSNKQVIYLLTYIDSKRKGQHRTNSELSFSYITFSKSSFSFPMILFSNREI